MKRPTSISIDALSEEHMQAVRAYLAKSPKKERSGIRNKGTYDSYVHVTADCQTDIDGDTAELSVPKYKNVTFEFSELDIPIKNSPEFEFESRRNDERKKVINGLTSLLAGFLT